MWSVGWPVREKTKLGTQTHREDTLASEEQLGSFCKLGDYFAQSDPNNNSS